MPRNLDLTSLRSLVTVADLGGVTRAAGYLNLTQSAVSMQLKRLEENLGVQLLERSSRSVGLTSQGEQLIGYARQMLALNDEACARLTDEAYEGELVLGIPHDIVYPAIPRVLRRFHMEYPRVKVQLTSGFTRVLKEQFNRGECDIIVTTEDQTDAGGEQMSRQPLVWVGAPEGTAFRSRPLMLAFEQRCIFRDRVQAALNEAYIPWEMATETHQTRTVEAVVSADLAVHAMIKGSVPPQTQEIDHRGALPPLGDVGINLYAQSKSGKAGLADLSNMIREAYSQEGAPYIRRGPQLVAS